MRAKSSSVRAALVLTSLLLAAPGVVLAQSAPVPPAPEEPSAEPGFDEPASSPPAKKKRAKKPKPNPDDEIYEPVNVPSQGSNERLIDNLKATRGEVTLGELIDEVLADVVAELDRRPARRISPMAIREISLGPNVKPSFENTLRGQFVSVVHTGTKIRMKRCLECQATRTKIENGEWVVTRGLVTTDEIREIGARLGVKSFMDITFEVEPEAGGLQMQFTLIDAETAHVIWADTFRADESTPMLLRSSEAPMKRKDRLRDLEMLLEGRPFYGYAASAGFMLLPYEDPVGGDITGATAGFRVYERFGKDRRIMFGLDMAGFLNTSRLAGGLISAGAWWIPLEPDFIWPELRVGGKAGAFIAGSEGNAAVFQLGLEALLRYRFGLYGYALFMTTSNFNGFNLGGLGFAAGLSFNW